MNHALTVALAAALFATPALAGNESIVAPAHLSDDDAKEWRSIEKKRLDMADQLADREIDLIEAREREARALAKIADAEKRHRSLIEDRKKTERKLERERKALAEMERELAAMGGESARLASSD